MKFFWVLFVAASAQAANSLDVQIPSGSTTNVAFTFTVTARNGATIDAAYAGTVHFTSDDPQAVLPSNYTFTPADAGTHTFSATMNSAGSGSSSANHTITATDIANASLNGTDLTTVRWNDNVVRLFSVAAPAAVDRTVPFQVEVRALNAGLFDVPSYTGTITFVASRQETVPPDYTFTSADAGRHTFSVTATLGDHSFFSVHDISDSSVFGSNLIDVRCPELVAMATNSGPVCPGSQALLFGSANLPVIDYHWISTLGHPPIFDSHQQNPAASPGTYILTVRQANECASMAQTVIETHNTTHPQVTLSPAALCVTNLHATITNPSDFSSLKWTTVGGTVVSGQGTPSVEISPNSGETRVWLALGAVETSSGCDASEFVAEVPIGNGVTTAISTVATTCAQVPESASVADAGSGATYAWTISNGAIMSGAGTRTIQYMPSGTGDVMLGATVTNGSCSAAGSAAVAVHAPAAVIDDRAVGLCSGSDAIIAVTLSGTPPFRIIWSDGDIQENIVALTASRTVSHAGSYWIAQFSDATCAGRSNGLVEVLATDMPAITAQPQGSTIRSGASATLTVAATGGGLRYRWYQGNSGDQTKLLVTTFNPSFATPPLSGTTSYWVEIENNCGMAESRAAVVTISDAPGKRRAVTH
jgi:hypothetical protein